MKTKYEHPEYSGQRGYVSFGKESAKGRSGYDERILVFWSILNSSEINNYNYFPNIKVEELPEFNCVCVKKKFTDP